MMKRASVILAVLILVFGSAGRGFAAPIVVATIDGAYDPVSPPQPSTHYDTPVLFFHNTSGGTFINAQMVLHVYQGPHVGITQTVALPNMPAGLTTIAWDTTGTPSAPFAVAGLLFTEDYDDSYGTNQQIVGNFDVTFTAILSGGPFSGQPVFSVFSPTTNATGGFVGWEGLDPTGLNETAFDSHSGDTGTFGGTLAVIALGLPPGVPEPTSVTLFGICIAGAAGYGWRRRKQAAIV